MSSTKTPVVYIISRCTNPANKLAAELTLESVRVGFPSFEVHLALLGEDHYLGTKMLKGIEMDFFEEFSYNHEVIEWIVENEQGPIIFLDSDLIFWKSCESFLMPGDCDFRGRLIPTHYDNFTNSITISRLHSSFLWIRDCGELRENIKLAFKDTCRFSPYNVFHPFYFKHKGSNVFYDTCAGLFHAVNSRSFTEEELDHFDHLMAGSFVDEIATKCPFPIYQNMLKYHRDVEQDRSKLKGVWKKQEEYFKLCGAGIKNEMLF